MLDIKEIRKNFKEIEARLKTKDPSINLKNILEDDTRLRAIIVEVEELKNKRNTASKAIGEKKRAGEDASEILKEVSTLGDKISKLDHEKIELEQKLFNQVAILPNLPSEDVPKGIDPKDNVCIKEYGKKRKFDFAFKNHMELNENLNLFDFKRGAKIAGAGWTVYTDFGARLEWALLNYMLDVHRKNGFTQLMLPLACRPEIMFGSAHLPKFEDQLFKISDEKYHLYLTPTSEVQMNGLFYDEILEEEELPKKYTAFTPCFRREAGAAGVGERGLIRTHQFNKVELFCISDPSSSEQMFEEMLKSAEEVLQGLEMHYRNMLLVTGDMSFASSKTIDIEVWLPGQDCYMEVSSVSNCTDFQARRSKIRFRKKGEKAELVHTLNASGVATSRLMVSLLENNQKEDGTIILPKVLHRYMEDEVAELKPN